MSAAGPLWLQNISIVVILMTLEGCCVLEYGALYRKNVENADFTWGESSSTFLLTAARQKAIIRMCQGYAAATGVFPLWLTERFSPKISKRTVLFEAVNQNHHFTFVTWSKRSRLGAEPHRFFADFRLKTFLETHLLNICLQVRKSETCSQKWQEQGTALRPRVQSPQKKNEVTTIQSVTGFFLIDLKHQNKTSTQRDSDGFFYSHFCPCVSGGGVSPQNF